MNTRADGNSGLVEGVLTAVNTRAATVETTEGKTVKVPVNNMQAAELLGAYAGKPVRFIPYALGERAGYRVVSNDSQGKLDITF